MVVFCFFLQTNCTILNAQQGATAHTLDFADLIVEVY